MGSMTHADPDRLTSIFLGAIERAGCRAIIQHGWSGLARQGGLPSNVYAADHLPHSWLFPRAAAVVHHGGAGTTAAALRAGVPTVVIPHALDQFVMAEHVRALGCVGGIIPYQELSVDALAEALADTLDQSSLRTAAGAASAMVRGEPGVGGAVDLIERLPPRQRR
jgi:UDP:flavonoid glycosyltransferase YjiC (YdhE family)